MQKEKRKEDPCDSSPGSPTSTCFPAEESDHSDAGQEGPRDPCSSCSTHSCGSPERQYLLVSEPLGSGHKTVVQRGQDEETGRDVAVKQVQCDTVCPVRFLEVFVHGERCLSAEGYVPANSPPVSWAGLLVHLPSNPYASAPYLAGSLRGCVVLARRGGDSTFAEKVQHARAGGADGLLVVNNNDELEPYTVGDTTLLPSVLLSQLDGEAALELAAIVEPEEACIGEGAIIARVFTDVGHELMVCRGLAPHPNVVEVIDGWPVGEAGLIIFEACSGGKVVPPLRTGTALWLVKQLLSGLAHLHSQGICHRDLKPDNVLLTRPLEQDGAKLVIIDFSMASTTRRMYIACGSPCYIAPEVLSGRYGPECDLWSAGMIAQEWLWGCHPYKHLSDPAIFERLVGCPEALLEVPEYLAGGRGTGAAAEADLRRQFEIAQSCRSLLAGLLTIDPAARLTAEQALGHPCLQGIA